MESLQCPTFGWDLELTPITSIYCKYSGPIISMILAETPGQKTVSIDRKFVHRTAGQDSHSSRPSRIEQKKYIST